MNGDCKIHESALFKREKIKHQTRQTEDTDKLAEPSIVDTANGRCILVFFPVPYYGDTCARKRDMRNSRLLSTSKMVSHGLFAETICS